MILTKKKSDLEFKKAKNFKRSKLSCSVFILHIKGSLQATSDYKYQRHSYIIAIISKIPRNPTANIFPTRNSMTAEKCDNFLVTYNIFLSLCN